MNATPLSDAECDCPARVLDPDSPGMVCPVCHQRFGAFDDADLWLIRAEQERTKNAVDALKSRWAQGL